MEMNTLSRLTDKTNSIMPATLSEQIQTRLAIRTGDNLMRKTYSEVIHEQGRAMLAYAALENTMLLSAFEAMCYRVAPFGELRYTQIVNAYAESAAKRIRGW